MLYVNHVYVGFQNRELSNQTQDHSGSPAIIRFVPEEFERTPLRLAQEKRSLAKRGCPEVEDFQAHPARVGTRSLRAEASGDGRCRGGDWSLRGIPSSSSLSRCFCGDIRESRIVSYCRTDLTTATRHGTFSRGEIRTTTILVAGPVVHSLLPASDGLYFLRDVGKPSLAARELHGREGVTQGAAYFGRPLPSAEPIAATAKQIPAKTSMAGTTTRPVR